MTTRRPWDSLSVPYRQRLQRSGVTQERYESGASLQAARGHAATPERPERAARDVARYAAYLRQRTKPIRVVTTGGLEELRIPDPADRSRVGSYDNAVKNMLAGKSPWRPAGDIGGAKLEDFVGRTVRGYRDDSDVLETFTLLTDPDALTARYYTGELRYEQIYPQSA